MTEPITETRHGYRARNRAVPVSEAGGWKAFAGIGAAFLFTAAMVAALWAFDINDEVVRLLNWIENQGVLAPLIFILLMALVVILLLPGVFFTTGAGFVFGLLEGTLYTVTGTTLGAGVAFLIARRFLGPQAKRFLEEHAARLRFVTDEMASEGWKIVLLMRLVPFFPTKLANYFLGLTSFPFVGFLGGSLIGFIPFTIHNVYLGSLAATLTVERQQVREPWQWALYLAGFAVTVGFAVYLMRLSRRALAQYTQQEGGR
jgi:uncharacterized membrane protein YdjX (TVP38/TMEM64 family)